MPLDAPVTTATLPASFDMESTPPLVLDINSGMIASAVLEESTYFAVSSGMVRAR